ncbi:MAG: type III-B CRISPR module RAMP protein Cmr4 [Acaryochloridaceae cyanobacterium RU_4_10]|nr:type III-B CRISPR module RAMP protein Cmr4 [Acaryochloridaceae cyanobacterium RU_4_10]
MYHKAYGIIETLAPLHIGASAGEETGNLNLIFRDQFTQTGIIPGSSIRGRFRADMRQKDGGWKDANRWYGHTSDADEEQKAEDKLKAEAEQELSKDRTTEALVKFEYASLVWFPVFCPGQPVVWISCPRLLKRYKLITGISVDQDPKPYSAGKGLQGRALDNSSGKVLFFNLGFMTLEHEVDLTPWIPTGADLDKDKLVVVGDNDIALLHDMGLYRQSRVALGSEENPNEKKVKGGAFFNVEALPEGSVLIFPVALKEKSWKPFGTEPTQDLYFGGLESIGFGHCRVTLQGDFQ